MSDAFHYTQTGYNEMGSIGAANVLSSQSYAFFQRTASTTSDIYFTAGNVGVGTTSPAALFFDLLDVERPKWQAPQALTPGKHTIVFDWKMDPQGTVVGRGGTGTLSVDGREVAKKSLPRTQPIIWAWDETFDIGRDTGTSVNSEDYSVPFPFTGTIGKITIDLGESTVSAEAIKKMMTELATKRDR